MRYFVQKLADLDFYTEGPVIDQDGNLFFTTLSGKAIGRIPANAPEAIEGPDALPCLPEKWTEGICPNGQVIHPNGEHWICESSTAQISIYSAEGIFSRVFIEKTCAGIPFSTPNDLILDTTGNLYFTESIRGKGKVFFVGTDGSEKLIADDIDYANGLALNAAEDTLYVAESYGNRILTFRIGNDTSRAERSVLADMPQHPSGDPIRNLPDGLAVDREGRIWVAHYGMQAVQVLSPEGKLLISLDTQLPLTSNIALIEDLPIRKKILVTGGYGEPGPGGVMLITIENLDDLLPEVLLPLAG